MGRKRGVKKLASGRWQVDVRVADGRRHRESFRTEKQADARYRELVDQREQGVLPAHGSGTLAEFIKDWEQTTAHSLRENTRAGYLGVVRNRILQGVGGQQPLGDHKLRKLDQRTVQAWVNALVAEGLDARTVEYSFAVLSTILGLAAQYGLCSPVRRAGRGRPGVRLPKKVRRPRTPPTVAQIERLCDVVDHRFGAAGIRVAGYCGLRQSEIFGLHPDAIDYERHRIHVYRTVGHRTRSVEDMTKSGKDRWVPMFDVVETALYAHMQEYPHSEFVFAWNGGRFDSSHFHKQVWAPARKAAKLDGVWFHDLRHSAASIMIAAGWSAKRVQEALGHHSAAFTLDQYSHLFREDDDAARTSLSTALGEAIQAAKNAPGGTRTHTSSQTPDFESGASTDSATGADEDGNA